MWYKLKNLTGNESRFFILDIKLKLKVTLSHSLPHLAVHIYGLYHERNQNQHEKLPDFGSSVLFAKSILRALLHPGGHFSEFILGITNKFHKICLAGHFPPLYAVQHPRCYPLFLLHSEWVVLCRNIPAPQQKTLKNDHFL